MKNRVFMIMIILIFSVLNSTCIKSTETENNSSDSSENSSSYSLLENSIISEATFVNIDFSKFPTLKEYKIPTENTIYVATNGDDSNGNGSEEFPYKTIAKAVLSAEPGDTIVVSGGTYKEVYQDGDFRGIYIDKDNITIMGKPGEEVVLLPKNGDVNYGIVVEANNITIRGIKIKNFNVGILFGDKIIKNSVITDCIIENVMEGIATWDGTLDSLLIYNVIIKNASLIGIHCGNGYGYNWRIEKTNIIMSGDSEDSGADGFAVEHGKNILLVENEVSGASADGIDTKAKDVTVYSCKVHNIGRNGVKLWYGGDIINSLIYKTGADASVVVEWGPKFRMLNTILAYHNYNGLISYNMTIGYDSQAKIDIEIINSIIFNTSGGAYFNRNSSLKISHTLFYNMQNGKILDYGDKTVYISEGVQGLNMFGEGNMVKDPKLKSDFHANQDSPIIDAGVKLSLNFPKYDMLRNNRVKGKNPDLGPFEDY